MPLISNGQAGHWTHAADLLQPGEAYEWIETGVTVRPYTFALRVTGDSMEPEFAHGTIVIVEPEMGVSETIVQWDIEQANAEADRRCRNWGYASAELFGTEFPVLVTCRPQGFSLCWSKSYRVTYQCLDR